MIWRTAVYENRTYGGVRGALAGLHSRQPSTRLVLVIFCQRDSKLPCLQKTTNERLESQIGKR
jgi:hypothetical protein